MTAEASTRDIVLAYLDAINAGDSERASDLVAADFFNEHTSSLGSSVHGREAYRERLPRFLRQFQGLHYHVEDLIVSGDRAAVAYTMTCSWLGDGGVIRPVNLRGVFRLRVNDGHIAHRVDYWDGAEFQRQTETIGAS